MTTLLRDGSTVEDPRLGRLPSGHTTHLERYPLTLDGRGHSGTWDLWQTSLDRLVEPLVLATPNRPSGLYEVRTEHRVYKRDLWLVGSREKS